MKGDVVMVTHSLIDGGMVGRVARLHGADITLDRAVGIGSGAWLAVRRQDGRLHMSRVDRAVAGLGPTRDLTLRKPVEDPADAYIKRLRRPDSGVLGEWNLESLNPVWPVMANQRLSDCLPVRHVTYRIKI